MKNKFYTTIYTPGESAHKFVNPSDTLDECAAKHEALRLEVGGVLYGVGSKTEFSTESPKRIYNIQYVD